MNTFISDGVFQGGEIEPGTFHKWAEHPKNSGVEAPTTHQTGGSDVGPAESEAA